MNKEKIGVIISSILQLLILVFIIISVYNNKYLVVIGGILSLFITFLPSIIKRKFGIHLPLTLNLLIVISLYLHIGGLTMGWYENFAPFYDKFGHFLGSVTVALLGFSLAIILEKYSTVIAPRPK